MTHVVPTSRQILAQRSTSQGRTFSYRGTGYTYHLHKTAKDIWIKLQMGRDKMKGFISWCWKNARSSFRSVDVCHQGNGGWFEVFTMDESKLFSVITFLKNLNQWMNGAFVQTVSKLRRRYSIVVREFIHTAPRHAPAQRIGYAPTPVVQQQPPARPIPYQSVLDTHDVLKAAPFFANLAKLQMGGVRA